MPENSVVPFLSRGHGGGGVSDQDTVILNPEDSHHAKATDIHIWNSPPQICKSYLINRCGTYRALAQAPGALGDAPCRYSAQPSRVYSRTSGRSGGVVPDSADQRHCPRTCGGVSLQPPVPAGPA